MSWDIKEKVKKLSFLTMNDAKQQTTPTGKNCMSYVGPLRLFHLKTSSAERGGGGELSGNRKPGLNHIKAHIHANPMHVQ